MRFERIIDQFFRTLQIRLVRATALTVLFAAGCGELPLEAADLPNEDVAEVAQALQPSLATLVDACEVQDYGLWGSDFLRLRQAEAFMISPTHLTQNQDGTYAISKRSYVALINPNGSSSQLDPNSKFYGQQQAVAGRSGFLVTDRHVITAPHTSSNDSTNPFSPSNFVVIFDLGSRMVNGICVQPDLDHIPAQNIFQARTSGYVNSKDLPNMGSADYAVFELDRPTGRLPIRIRRAGTPDVGDSMYGIAHPERLSTKVDTAVSFAGMYGTNPAFNGYHGLPGSSGGMLYNVQKDYVEAVFASGLGCSSYQNTANALPVLTSDCPTGSMYWWQILPNASIKSFAAHVPSFELQVSPLDSVVHKSVLGGPLSNLTTTYTLKAATHGSSASGTYGWQISAGPTPLCLGCPLYPKVLPTLAFAPAMSGTLPAGGSTQVSVTANYTGTKCMKYGRTFTVKDQVSGYWDNIRHTFEVGLKQYSTTPTTNFEGGSVVGPSYSSPVSTSYTVKNVQPSPARVVVTVPNWIDATHLFSVVPWSLGPTTSTTHSITATLGPEGSNTASSSISFKTNNGVEALPYHTPVAGIITFGYDAADLPCAPVPSETRQITYTKAAKKYTTISQGNVPISTSAGSFGTALVSQFNVSEEFFIYRAKLDVGFKNPQMTQLKIVLVSPAGQQYVLWDRNQAPNPGYMSTEEIGSYPQSQTSQVLRINDLITPAPTGQQLSDLAGQLSKGAWKLQVYSASTFRTTFTHWRLELQAMPEEWQGCTPDGLCYY